MTDPIDLPPLVFDILNEFHTYNHFSGTHVLLKLKLPESVGALFIVRDVLKKHPDLFEQLPGIIATFRVTPAGKRLVGCCKPPEDVVADTVRNLMGLFDNAVERRRRAGDTLYEAAIETGRRALALLDEEKR